jgi:hypothetical protein
MNLNPISWLAYAVHIAARVRGTEPFPAAEDGHKEYSLRCPKVSLGLWISQKHSLPGYAATPLFTRAFMRVDSILLCVGTTGRTEVHQVSSTVSN